MKTLFLFPPGWNTECPHLALPLLKGQMNQAGHFSIVKDLNIEFYNYLLRAEFQKKARTILSQKPNSEKIATALMYCEETIKWVEEAKNIFLAKTFLADAQHVGFSESIINKALFVASCISEKINIQLKGITYDFNIAKFSNVLPFIKNIEDNIFLDFYRNQLEEHIKESSYDILAISLTSDIQLIPTLILCNWLEETGMLNSRKIVIGGNYFSRIIKKWHKVPEVFKRVDFFIYDEGEMAICKLVDALKGNCQITSVPNLIIVEKDLSFQRTSYREHDINSNAVPDFSDLNLQQYFSPETMLPIYATRGCPNRCSFCSIPAVSGSYRKRDLDKIYSEMDKLAKQYKTRFFYFVDETMPLNLMKELSARLVYNNRNLFWMAETRFSNGFTNEICQLLSRAGCKKLQFGLESYNTRILELMNKNIPFDSIETTLLNCLNNGISIHLFWMFGFPGEKPEETNNTVEFVKKMILLSQDKYKNNFSTVAMGPFGLDEGSFISKFPESFGIKITQSEEDAELTIKCEYVPIDSSSSNNINREQANNTVASFNKMDIRFVKIIFEQALKVPYWHFFMKQKFDVRLFVQQCNQYTNETEGSSRQHTDKMIKNHYISLFENHIDLWGNNKNGTNYYIINSLSNRFIRLEYHEFQLIKGALKNDISSLSSQDKELCCYLSQTDVVDFPCLNDIDINEGVLKIGRHIKIELYKGHNYVLDMSCGKIVEVNSVIMQILSVVENGKTANVCYQELQGILNESISKDVFIEVIKELIQKKILYLAP